MSEFGSMSEVCVSVELSFADRQVMERMADPVDSFMAEPLRETQGICRSVDSGRLIGEKPTGEMRVVRNRMELAQALMARIPERCPDTVLREAEVGNAKATAAAMPVRVTLAAGSPDALPAPGELADYVRRAVRDAFDEAHAPTHERELPATPGGM